MKKNWTKLTAALLLAMSWQVAAMSQTKIAVVTDTHVMNPYLLVEDGTAWQDELAADRKLIDYSKVIFDVLVEQFKTSSKPDLLLITGDLTKDGEKISHEYVKGKLKELKEAGVKVFVIPGNHDIDNSNAESYNGGTTTRVESISSNGFAEMYADYGYSNTERDENSLSYACEPIEGLVLIGIDSHTGSLPDGTLDWVCGQATKAWQEGKQVIAMMHHPLFPHILGADMYVSSATVANYETVRNSLADAGVRVILTGHFHTSDIAKDWNAGLTKAIYDVNTGSVISYPCDYRIMTLSEDLQTLDISTESITSLPSNPTFSKTAESRLTESMTKIATAKLGNTLASLAAGVFKIHAEGNENKSKNSDSYISSFKLAKTFDPLTGNQIENKLTALGFTWDSFEAILNSILKDISNYGVEGRADQTDDRTLTITMPDLTEGLTLAGDGWSTYCSDRRLDLTKTADITGYIVESVTTNAVQLKEVSIIPANTGFIINGNGSTAIKLNATDSDADDVSGNQLTGILEATPAPENAYVLSTKNGETGFYPVQSDLNLPARKAYLTISSGSGTRQLVMPNGETTGIREAVQQTQNALYNLQGMQVGKPSKGIFVKNGKLIIIK